MAMKYRVQLTADLKNLTDLQPGGGVGNQYSLKLECSYCTEVEDLTVCYDQERTAERTPHLTKKCHSCQIARSVTVLRGRVPLSEDEEEESGQLLELLCEGCKPVEFVFGRGWQAENPTTGTIFDIDLSAGGDFIDYDQKAGCPVEVLNARATITVDCLLDNKYARPRVS